MRLIEYRAARGLVHTAALDADEPVFNYIQQADAVLAAKLVELQDNTLGSKLLTVDRNGNSLLKVNGDIGGHIGCVDGAHAHFKESLLLVGGFVAGILKIQTLVGEMPEVLVLGVIGLTVYLQRHVVRLGVVDLLIAGLYRPLAPGSYYGHIGSKVLYGQLETDLIVALAGAAVAYGVRALLYGDVNKALCDAGTRVAGAQQVILVNGSGLQAGHDVIGCVLLGEVENIQLACARLDCLLFKTLKLVGLTDIAGDCDDLAVIVVFLKPGDDDGCIQTAGIGEHHFFYVIFIHNIYLRMNKYSLFTSKFISLYSFDVNSILAYNFMFVHYCSIISVISDYFCIYIPPLPVFKLSGQ